MAETDPEKERIERERERERIIKEQRDYEAERKRIRDQRVRDTHKPPKPTDDD